MKHTLKTLPQYFQAVWIGDKTFEIRKNDRNFQERDEVVLQEWESQSHTGREVHGVIRYLTDYEQKPGYVVFAFYITGRQEE